MRNNPAVPALPALVVIAAAGALCPAPEANAAEITQSTIVIDTPQTEPIEAFQQDVVFLEGGSLTVAENGGFPPALFVGRELDLRAGSISYAGNRGPAVDAQGGFLNLRGGDILSTGEQSPAIRAGDRVELSAGTVRTEGRLTDTITVFGDADFRMTGGRVETAGTESVPIFFFNESRGEISGGTVEVTGDASLGIRTFGTSELLVSGGLIRNSGNNVFTFNDIGGQVSSPPAAGIRASESSRVSITGGTIELAFTGPDSEFNSGGVAVQALSRSRVTISGGDIVTPAGSFDLVSLGDNAVVDILAGAEGLTLDGQSLDLAGRRVIELTDEVTGFRSESPRIAVLEGFFRDGDPFSLSFGNVAAYRTIPGNVNAFTNGSIRLVVPEPASVTLLLAGTGLLLRRRRA